MRNVIKFLLVVVFVLVILQLRSLNMCISSEPKKKEKGKVVDSTAGGKKVLKTDSEKPKVILFGSKWWDFPNYPFFNETKEYCPKCIFTQDMRLLDSSDAIVFHGITIPRRPPPRKNPNQVWVWFYLEAPSTQSSRHTYTEHYENLINWTMTYRSDSDIVVPYGRIVSNDEIPQPKFNEKWAFMHSDYASGNEMYDENSLAIPTTKELKNRKLVAWVASNCKTPSGREFLVRELHKYIPVDTYGLCGTKNCQLKKLYRTNVSGNFGLNCRLKISKKYKFYLAFENSLCEDYVTEKFFDTLLTQMIPVVYGGANYSNFAPKNSYIDVSDFKTMKDLAEYLTFLDQHPKEYLKYFEWRRKYWVQNNGFLTGYCDLCEKLWANGNKTKSYRSIKHWWFRKSGFDEKGGGMACKSGKEFIKRRTDLVL